MMMSLANFSKSVEKRWLFWIGGILFLALILRVWGLSSESAWIDEAYSIVLANHSPLEIITGTAADQHPPLYYLLLHSWLQLGKSVNFARWLSIWIGLIGVYQTMILGKNLGGNVIGVLSGILIAVSPMHIWYSQEARMYILLATFTTGATHMLWNGLNKPGRRWWIGYLTFALLALYTQYFALFVLIAHGIWIFVSAVRAKQFSDLAQWVLSIGIVGILFLPWIPTMLYQSQAHALEWLSSPSLTEIRNVFLQLVFGAGIQALPGWIRTILLLFLISSIITVFLVIKNMEERFSYTFLAWLSFFPFVLVAIISIRYPIFQYKQFIILLSPLLILIAFTAKKLPRYWGIALLGMVIFVALVTIVYQAISITKDDWQGATNYIEDRIQPDDIVFGNPAAISLATSIYADTLLPIGYPPNYNIISGGWEGQIITEDIANDVMQTATQGKQRLWLVEYFPSLWDPEQRLENWLSENGVKIDDQYFGRIRVRLYEFYGGETDGK